MTTLDQIQPNAALLGILPDCAVTVVNVQWFGSEALELMYKDPSGKVANVLLYTVRQREEHRFEITHVPAPVRNRDRLVGVGEPVLARYERLGYDIESRDLKTGKLRFLEVKGRISGADTVTVTRNEILYSLKATHMIMNRSICEPQVVFPPRETCPRLATKSYGPSYGQGFPKPRHLGPTHMMYGRCSEVAARCRVSSAGARLTYR